MLPGQERPLSPNLQSWVMRFWKDTETENKQSTPMCAQLCMQGEGGRDSGLGRINHFYGTLWGVFPPGTAEKTRPIQASEKLRRFSPMCKQHAGACCFHFYYPPTGQSGDYCRWKHIALSFSFTRASFQYITLARLDQCRTAAMGNVPSGCKAVTAVLWHVCNSLSSHCSSQYELL